MTSHRFLVTAGNTREMIDRVRDWGNVFTGNTGYAIARELAGLGQVDLLTSNRWHLAELATTQHTSHAICAHSFSSHTELRGELEALMARGVYDAVFMTAAVADYRPAGVFEVLHSSEPDAQGRQTWVVRDVQAGKVKSTHRQIAVLGEPTEKLVDLFRSRWNHRGLLFKFKLEVGITPETLLEIGRKSRIASGADYLVANTLEMVSGPEAGAYLVYEKGEEFVPRAMLASRLGQEVRRRLAGRG